LTLLLDVPAQLALVLSLAAATVAHEPPRAGAIEPSTALQSAATVQVGELAGPYRFGEGMWLRALKEGLRGDASGYAQGIFRTSGGRYYVPRQDERQRILGARHDPALAARAARAFAQANARALRSSLRRAPTAGELWIAHLFGPEAASRLIVRARSHPGAPAASEVPELAAAAQALIGQRAASLTLAQLYAQLTLPLERALAEARPVPREATQALADMLQQGQAWGALRPNPMWQTEISAADAGRPAQ
jgi:hypothetical protein